MDPDTAARRGFNPRDFDLGHNLRHSRGNKHGNRGCHFLQRLFDSPTQLEVALEEPGFDSLRVAEHSHIPVTRRFNVPGGGELTRQYYDVMDPFVTLSAAAVTTRHANVRICAGFRTPAVTSLLRARAAGA